MKNSQLIHDFDRFFLRLLAYQSEIQIRWSTSTEINQSITSLHPVGQSIDCFVMCLILSVSVSMDIQFKQPIALSNHRQIITKSCKEKRADFNHSLAVGVIYILFNDMILVWMVSCCETSFFSWCFNPTSEVGVIPSSVIVTRYSQLISEMLINWTDRKSK